MRTKHGPEYHIQNDLVEYLRVRGWLVERLIGNAFQVGIPDLFLHHPKWGSRWVDVKVDGHYSFTKAQKIKWPLWETYNLGIWILTAATQAEYDKLFAPPNWRSFVKKNWKLPTQAEIDELLDDVA
jgi:hypothetical protein